MTPSRESALRTKNQVGPKSGLGLHLNLTGTSPRNIRKVQVSELIEARDEKHLLRFQKLLASYELLIVY